MAQTGFAIIVSILLAALIPLFIAAILYLPLRWMLNRHMFARRGMFLLVHLVLSILVPAFFAYISAPSDCPPDAHRSCGDMATGIIHIWLILVVVVTFILSPLIANTMYVRTQD